MSTQAAVTNATAPTTAAADAKDAKANGTGSGSDSSSSSSGHSDGPGTWFVDAKGEKHFNYFAIGSMINPISLSLRGLTPSASWAGRVDDWELVFMGEGGMGSISEKKGAFLHGVLHVVNAAEMKALDQMEGGYDHVDVTVQLYDGTSKQAIAYKFKPDRVKAMTKHNPPGERYIDIIVRGCQHYGVQQSWIDYLKTLTVTPRKDPKDFVRLPEPAGAFADARYTYAEVAQHDGRDGRDLMFVVNGKVLKWTGDKSAGSALTFEWLRNNVGGKDATLFWGRGLYEPKYPVARTLADMVPEHRLWVEDMASGRMFSQMTVVGRLKDGEEEAVAKAEKEAAAKAAAAVATATTAAKAN